MSFGSALAGAESRIRYALEACGCLVFAVALWAVTKNLFAPINVFDEGIILSNANFILAGKLPHRDFYTNYPPGIFYLTALIWRALGTSLLSERVLGLVGLVSIAMLGGRIAGLCIGRSFSWLAAGIALMWMSTLHTRPSAFSFGLAIALLLVLTASKALRTRRAAHWASAGFLWALLSFFRHDLFIYFSLALLVVLAFLLGSGMKEFFGQFPGSALAAFTASALLILGSTWGFTLATGGRAVIQDLYLDQVRYVIPARVLPMPSLFELKPAGPLPFVAPAFFTRAFEGAVSLALIGPALAIAAWSGKKLFRWAEPAIIAAVGALTLAALPQVLGRTDIVHSVYPAVPTIILASAMAQSVVNGLRRVGVKLAAAVCTLVLLLYPTRTYWLRFSSAEFPTLPHGPPRTLRPLAPSRQEVVGFIHQNTSADEPIFVGTHQHRRIWVNELVLYYLANRTPATRYTQFDPGLTNRFDVQEQMVQDFEKNRPRLIVLAACCLRDEPNKSREEGASLLDGYLRTHYRLEREVDEYRLLLRRTP